VNLSLSYRVIFGVTVGWVVGYFATILLASGMSAAEGYAWLSGWWFGAYLSKGTAIRLKQALLLYAVALFVAILGQAFYVLSRHDEVGFPYTAIKIAVQGFIFASPAYFSAVLKWLKLTGSGSLPDRS